MNTVQALHRVFVNEMPEVLVDIHNGKEGLEFDFEVPKATSIGNWFEVAKELVEQVRDGLEVEYKVDGRFMVAIVKPRLVTGV